MIDGISIGRRAGHVLFLSMLAAVVGLAGCTPPESPTPTPTPRDDTVIRTALSEGVHGDTYDVGTGPNTYCAQCKSPVNYDPQSAIDLPPNCLPAHPFDNGEMTIRDELLAP